MMSAGEDTVFESAAPAEPEPATINFNVSMKKGTSSSSAVMFSAQGDEEDVKPLRSIVPLDYTDEERKEERLFKYVLDNDTEDLDGKVKKVAAANSASATVQATSTAIDAMKTATLKAAEIAAKLASTMKPADMQKMKQKQLVDQIPTDK